jgi:hypothetical protein
MKLIIGVGFMTFIYFYVLKSYNQIIICIFVHEV